MHPFANHQHGLSRNFNRLSVSSGEKTPLSVGYIPGPLDVICARGKVASNHSGNRRFNVVIDMRLQEYAEASTKMEKSLIVSSIVDSIREASPQGGFIKNIDGRWYAVGDVAAREKVGQSLRNALHTKYRSSTKAKRLRREAEATLSHNLDISQEAMNVSQVSTQEDVGLGEFGLTNEEKVGQTISKKNEGIENTKTVNPVASANSTKPLFQIQGCDDMWQSEGDIQIESQCELYDGFFARHVGFRKEQGDLGEAAKQSFLETRITSSALPSDPQKHSEVDASKRPRIQREQQKK